VARSGDGTPAAILASHDFDDFTMAYDVDLETKVAALTPQQVQETLHGNLDVSALSIVKAGDFQKAAATQYSSAPCANFWFAPNSKPGRASRILF
jgi:zinc protease